MNFQELPPRLQKELLDVISRVNTRFVGRPWWSPLKTEIDDALVFALARVETPMGRLSKFFQLRVDDFDLVGRNAIIAFSVRPDAPPLRPLLAHYEDQHGTDSLH